ncbi:MAG TPA: hypothetical protein VF046_05610, partial [Gemmatimonadales bacterium]
MRLSVVCLLACVSAHPALAQRSASGDTSAAVRFERLDLPTPTTIRTGSGEPGRGYWQQRADYV